MKFEIGINTYPPLNKTSIHVTIDVPGNVAVDDILAEMNQVRKNLGVLGRPFNEEKKEI